jgi:hypothetical protein
VQESAFRDTTDVFTEYRGAVELGLRHDSEAWRVDARARASAGTDLVREDLGLDLRWRPDTAHTLDLDLDLQGRQFRDDSDFSLNSDTFEGRARAHWRRRLGETWRVGVRTRQELLRYEERSIYELDSQRSELSLTADLRSGWSDWLALELGAGRRGVRDSSAIAYDRVFGRLDGSLELDDRVQVSLHHSFERRVYDDEQVRSPFWDLVVEPELRLRLGDAIELRWHSPLEWLQYDTGTTVYFDSFLGRSGLMLAGQRGGFEWGFEPRWSWLQSPSEVEDEYVQPSFLVRVDWFGSERWWFSLSEEVGHRDYRDPPEDGLNLYSDYTFLRTTFLGSFRLTENLSLEGFLSDEPESHRSDADDARLTLVTASIRWTW